MRTEDENLPCYGFQAVSKHYPNLISTLSEDDPTIGRSLQGLAFSKKSRRKEKGTALILCVLLGFLGAHRFYARRHLGGAFMLLTLGGFGFIWFWDIFSILTDSFTDSSGLSLL
jgi:hypothetical protein